VCQLWPARIHIASDDGLTAEFDRPVGGRCRDAFVAELMTRGLGAERRRDDIETALGRLPDSPSGWEEQARRTEDYSGRSPWPAVDFSR